MVVAEPLLDLVLAAERLHDRVAGEGLLDLPVEGAGVAPLRDVAGPGPRADGSHRPDRQRHGGERDQASSGEIVNIIPIDADEQQHRREHLAQRLLEALGHVVEVVGDPAEQVAAAAGRCS